MAYRSYILIETEKEAKPSAINDAIRELPRADQFRPGQITVIDSDEVRNFTYSVITLVKVDDLDDLGKIITAIQDMEGVRLANACITVHLTKNA